MKTLSSITSNIPSDKLALKHYESLKVLNSCCFQHQKHDTSCFQQPRVRGDFDNKMRYLVLDVVHHCVRCCAGQSDYKNGLKIYNMPFQVMSQYLCICSDIILLSSTYFCVSEYFIHSKPHEMFCVSDFAVGQS